MCRACRSPPSGQPRHATSTTCKCPSVGACNRGIRHCTVAVRRHPSPTSTIRSNPNPARIRAARQSPKIEDAARRQIDRAGLSSSFALLSCRLLSTTSSIRSLKEIFKLTLNTNSAAPPICVISKYLQHPSAGGVEPQLFEIKAATLGNASGFVFSMPQTYSSSTWSRVRNAYIV